MLVRRMDWTSSTPDLLTTQIEDSTGTRFYLLVEALPDKGWDWAAWVGDHTRRSLHGEALSCQAAMAAAESAARLLGRICMFPEVA